MVSRKRASLTRSAHFLSVSVDPRNDTPEVIKAYMVKNQLDQTNWRFVTGDERAVEDFVVGGFKVGYGRTPWSTELTHSNSFALVIATMDTGTAAHAGPDAVSGTGD